MWAFFLVVYMKCSRPRYAWESLALNPNGKRPIVFNPSFGIPGSGRDVACGKCIACKMNHSRDSAVRLYQECQLSDTSCVATLTFDDAHCPDRIEDIRNIAKMFKRRLERAGIDKRSHWLCEYGGKFDRPHAHVIFFNEDFRDGGTEVINGTSYRSNRMDELWRMGHVQLDIVSPQACRYTAGHNQQKLLASPRDDGSATAFTIPATKPAIGMRFAREFSGDIQRLNACVVGSSETAVPRTYLKYEPDLFAGVIEHRKQFALDHASADFDDTVAGGDRREDSARMRLVQAAEARAWHRGCHH